MNCAEARHSLGVYVLGALEPAERADVDRHITQCPSCREEVALFAGLPGLLGHLDLDDVEALEVGSGSPDPGLLDRALAQVRAERRRTHRLRLAVAASAVAATALAGGVYAAVSGPGSGPGTTAAQTTARATDPVTHVQAAAALTAKAWGTQISLQLSGVPLGDHCRLIARAKNGQQQVAGSWEVGYSGTAAVTSAVSIPKTELRELDVVTFAGQRLVRIPLSG